mmetsp:Transcript_28085/g.45046  ORF Transcript_28085/g.45046 Transcript_28085/m.45046 type:complete len:99 (+) Transcript_28085:4058-4354(+)
MMPGVEYVNNKAGNLGLARIGLHTLREHDSRATRQVAASGVPVGKLVDRDPAAPVVCEKIPAGRPMELGGQDCGTWVVPRERTGGWRHAGHWAHAYID